jgi:PAS domain S-box-containing protein
MEDPINILIVDDEPKNLTVLETVLDDPSYRLVRAGSADQALLALVVEEFALLILDIRMPGMTGFELAEMIKERKKTARVPIIFLTAYYNEDQHVLEGYESGAVDYIHKPLNPAILRSKVAVFAELHRKSREVAQANRALLAEVTERRRAEEQLLELNETLEQRVTERTMAMSDSEIRYRRLFEAAQDGILILDFHSGKVVDVNPFMTDLLGYSREEFLGLELWNLGLFSDKLANEAAVRELQEKGYVRYEHLPLKSKVGQPVEVEVVANAYREDHHSVIQCNIRDITERRRLERELQVQAEVLADQHRRKDDFLATLAHELRNPLAPIQSAVDLMNMKGDAIPELQWIREVIDRQLKQMTRLIDDLMDVSRIRQGTVVLRRQHIELSKVILLAVETSRALIDDQCHTLTVTLPPNPVILDADLTRMAQVFLNLLNNATKYMDPGGRIHLRAEQQGSDIVVTVRDTGIGIHADNLPNIFEMFSQVEDALSRARGGLGLGLSLVKRLVELHGGSVEAFSEGLGKGSEFVVRLPIVVEQSYDRASIDDIEAVTPTSNLRILVVDDNRDAALTLSKLLEQMGNIVCTAHDGIAAVQAAGEFRPHVVLCDIGLPKLNGYEACKQIREQAWDKSMILIAVSGWGQDEDRQKSTNAGFDHHMVKPVNLVALTKLLAGLNIEKV